MTMASSSRSAIAASRAPQNRRAAVATATSTGWTSVGDCEIARRMSAVAVCCSSVSREIAVARLQLLEQAHVLDGDDRLVGEAGDQLDLLLREQLDIEPVEREDSEESPISHHGNRQERVGSQGVAKIHPSRIQGPRGHRQYGWFDAPWRPVPGPEPRPGRRGCSSRRAEARARSLWWATGAKDLPVEPPDDPLIGVAESRGVLHEGSQHRLEVEGRAADHLEDFAGRRLLLTRFRQELLELAPRDKSPPRLSRSGWLGSALRLLRDASRSPRPRSR